MTAAWPHNVAIMPAPAVSADGSTAELATGEILLLPAELWQAIDEAALVAADAESKAPEDQKWEASRTAFVAAFARALHQRGLVVLKPADAKSTQSVSLQTYSLALSQKHAVEGKLAALRMAVMGWSSYAPDGASEDKPPTLRNLGEGGLLHDMAQGVLALAGRAPPDDRRRLGPAFVRLRAIAAILEGTPTAGWDIAAAPPLPSALVDLVEGKETP